MEGGQRLSFEVFHVPMGIHSPLVFLVLLEVPGSLVGFFLAHLVLLILAPWGVQLSVNGIQSQYLYFRMRDRN